MKIESSPDLPHTIIINDTNLSYETIGKIIDTIIDRDIGNTHYFGQIEYTTYELESGEKIRVQIRYMKRFTDWSFSYEK
jgi:predicted transcriptional regulator